MRDAILLLCLMSFFVAVPVLASEGEGKDSEKVEPVKRAEFFREQQLLFNKTDKNFDGQITHDEILRLTHDVNRPKYRAAFKSLDTNNNGFLSFDEVKARHEDFTRQRVERLPQSKDALLKKYDIDGDGTITSGEIDTYFETKGRDMRKQTEKNAERDMKAKDSDDSGSVSFEEYLESKQTMRRPIFSGPAITRDPNGDKIIKRSENEAFVRQLFDSFDLNKDDELSIAEQSSRTFGAAKRLTAKKHYLRKEKP